MAGFIVQVCQSIDQAVELRLYSNVDAVLVELGNNGIDGKTAVKQIREAQFGRPLILICGRSDWRDAVATLEEGADDYLIKPVHSEEIAARLRRSVRQSRGFSAERPKVGNFTLDLGAKRAWLNDEHLSLTRNEFRCLQILLMNLGRNIDADEIRTGLAKGGLVVSQNAIEVMISRLRKKIGSGAIKTARGIGYRIETDDRVYIQKSTVQYNK